MADIDEKGRKPSDIQLGDLQDLTVLGYKPELQRNRSMFTLLFQSLAIAAVSVLILYLIPKAKIFCRYRMVLAVL
ncbi:hypothetical protein F5X97DRAFT_288645 [Nemania serpens]|nr:hypothetical protein F5X97DRAFT_288645 [Nemania serpens]